MGVLAEPGEVPDQFTADAYGDEHRGDQGEEAEDARDACLDQDAVTGGLAAVLEAVVHLRGVVGQPLQDRRGGLLPALGVDGARVLGGASLDEGLLRRPQRFAVRTRPVPLHALALRRGKRVHVDLVEQLSIGHEIGYLAQFGGGEPPGDERRGDQGVFAGEHFAGSRDADQCADLLVHRHVLHRAESGQEAIAGIYEAAVELHRLGAVDGAPVDRFAERAEALDRAEDGIQLGVVVGAQRVADVLLPGAVLDTGKDPVGGRPLALQEREGVGGPGVGEEDEGLAALVLDGPDGVLQRMTDLLHQSLRALSR